ncbi:hypothetical protein BaRGS_00002174 [Batillaria attramentaria]|uniref:Uncharacterized protein n=1 Tax=Batillaria attramentaria TaxID=370345 RepID=A0ABD0M4D9_9CAEN
MPRKKHTIFLIHCKRVTVSRMFHAKLSVCLPHCPFCLCGPAEKKSRLLQTIGVVSLQAVAQTCTMAAILGENLQALHTIHKQSGASGRDQIDGLIADVTQICMHEISEKDKG